MQIFRKNTMSLYMLLIFLILAVSGCARMVPQAAAPDNVVLKDSVLNDNKPNDIILNDLQGGSVNFSAFKNPTILFFWTTWCPYCRKEIKALNQIYPQMEKEGITVFAINVSEPEYKVRKFFKDYMLNFRVLLDESGLVADKYSIIGVPTYILLDKSGNIILSENRFPVNYKSLLLKQDNN